MAPKLSRSSAKVEDSARNWPEQTDPDRARRTAEAESAASRAEWQKAIQLWLRWSEAYDQVTSKMFDARQDQEQLESLLDSLDQLRQQALAASRKLLE